MSANKSFLHKETGDKETVRRGKYLRKLFNENALGPNKTLLNKVHQAPSFARGDPSQIDQSTGQGKESMEEILQK